jgi:hypothetical protein
VGPAVRHVSLKLSPMTCDVNRPWITTISTNALRSVLYMAVELRFWGTQGRERAHRNADRVVVPGRHLTSYADWAPIVARRLRLPGAPPCPGAGGPVGATCTTGRPTTNPTTGVCDQPTAPRVSGHRQLTQCRAPRVARFAASDSPTPGRLTDLDGDLGIAGLPGHHSCSAPKAAQQEKHGDWLEADPGEQERLRRRNRSAGSGFESLAAHAQKAQVRPSPVRSGP